MEHKFKKIPYWGNVTFEVDRPPYEPHHRASHLLYEIPFTLTIGRRKHHRVSMFRLPHGHVYVEKAAGRWEVEDATPLLPGGFNGGSGQEEIFEFISKNPAVLLKEHRRNFYHL